jgi:GT2 family glycosyltransferase
MAWHRESGFALETERCRFIMKTVAVVVLNWNGWRDTVACIQSLKQLNYLNFRIWVVDNASSDESVERIREAFPDLDILQSGANLGFGGGCNVGIRRALDVGAEYIWLINSDTRVAPDALLQMVEQAEACPRAGAVGSVIYEMDEPDRVQVWGGGLVNLWLGQSHHRLVPGSVDFVSGASVLLRAEAVRDVGLFDDQMFFMYWEDTDLGFRLRKAGWQLDVASQAKVWHKQSASLGLESPLLVEYGTCSAVRFLRRHAPVPWVSIPLMGLLRIGKRLLRGDWIRLRAFCRGWVKA